MRLTAKKNISHVEIVNTLDKYEVRLKLDSGVIITILVETEDGEFQSFEGKKKKDRGVISKMKPEESNYVEEFLTEQTWE